MLPYDVFCSIQVFRGTLHDCRTKISPSRSRGRSRAGPRNRPAFRSVFDKCEAIAFDGLCSPKAKMCLLDIRGRQTRNRRRLWTSVFAKWGVTIIRDPKLHTHTHTHTRLWRSPLGVQCGSLFMRPLGLPHCAALRSRSWLYTGICDVRV